MQRNTGERRVMTQFQDSYLVLFLLCLLSAFPSTSPEPPSFEFKLSRCNRDVSESPWPELESDPFPSADAGASEEDLSWGNVAVFSSPMMVDIHNTPIPKNAIYLQTTIPRVWGLNGGCWPNWYCDKWRGSRYAFVDGVDVPNREIPAILDLASKSTYLYQRVVGATIWKNPLNATYSTCILRLVPELLNCKLVKDFEWFVLWFVLHL